MGNIHKQPLTVSREDLPADPPEAVNKRSGRFSRSQPARRFGGNSPERAVQQSAKMQRSEQAGAVHDHMRLYSGRLAIVQNVVPPGETTREAIDNRAVDLASQLSRMNVLQSGGLVGIRPFTSEAEWREDPAKLLAGSQALAEVLMEDHKMMAIIYAGAMTVKDYDTIHMLDRAPYRLDGALKFLEEHSGYDVHGTAIEDDIQLGNGSLSYLGVAGRAIPPELENSQAVVLENVSPAGEYTWTPLEAYNPNTN